MQNNGGNHDYYIVEGEPVDIAEHPWDILVILDACRYDVFKEVYQKYIPGGTLKKAYSPATHTPEYLYRCYHDKHLNDTIYVSSNAYCNNLNVPVNASKEYQFNPTPHFKRVIDVWYDGWNENLGTIHPEEVNKHAIASLDLHPHNRHIIHYMQPHTPYITLGEQTTTDGTGIRHKPKMAAAQHICSEDRALLFRLATLANRFMSDETMWRLGNLVGMLPDGGYGSLWLRYGTRGMQAWYASEVELVLGYVRRLLARYPSHHVLITADHGERLGENGDWLHSKVKRRDEPILAVPWLEVD